MTKTVLEIALNSGSENLAPTSDWLSTGIDLDGLEWP